MAGRCLAMVLLISGSLCWTAAQTPTQKPAASAKSQSSPTKAAAPKARTRTTFECPDPEAKQACKSYEELLRAKDTSLPSDGYVCFRKNADEFFVFSFTKPYFRKRWDAEEKQTVIDSDYTPSGAGSVRTYTNGIEDDNSMPSFFFSGKWQAMPSFSAKQAIDSAFTSDTINFKKQSDDEKDVGISISDDQINVSYKYESKLGDTTVYTLAVQRSTGRFSESFQKDNEKLPFLQNLGYCIYRH